MGTVSTLREFFATSRRPVETKELTALKKADPEGMTRIAEGIENGTFDYEPTGE